MQLDKIMLVILAGFGALVVLYAKLLDIALYVLLVGLPLVIIYKLVT